MNKIISIQAIPDHNPIIAGVSGGPDSMCLLYLLHQAAGSRIVVAHFNHQLRPEAQLEADLVASLAEKMKLPFIGGSMDVRAFAEEKHFSLEEAARTLRYRFLFSEARKQNAAAVAVGHTADDQAETVLMHFIRGAGLGGLKGMTQRTILTEFDPHIPLIRPILHLWRSETEAFCLEHGLKPIQDPTNQDEAFFRNRLRHSLIPELERYNPKIKNVLVHTADALAGDHEALSEAVENIWLDSLAQSEPGLVSLHAIKVENMGPGLRRNFLRKAIEAADPGQRNLDFETLQRASDFIDGGVNSSQKAMLPRQIDLLNGLTMLREQGLIHIKARNVKLPVRDFPQVTREFSLVVDIPLALENGYELLASILPDRPAKEKLAGNDAPYTAWLDADLVGKTLTVRPCLPGDEFSPLGMARQNVKLREFYINVKMPQRARAGWPIIFSGASIIWVPGFRLAHPYRVTDQTNRVINITLYKNN